MNTTFIVPTHRARTAAPAPVVVPDPPIVLPAPVSTARVPGKVKMCYCPDHTAETQTPPYVPPLNTRGTDPLLKKKVYVETQTPPWAPVPNINLPSYPDKNQTPPWAPVISTRTDGKKILTLVKPSGYDTVQAGDTMSGVPLDWYDVGPSRSTEGNYNAIKFSVPTIDFGNAPSSSGNSSSNGSGSGINLNNIINQGFALTSQFLGSRGRYQTTQIGNGIGVIPNVAAVANASNAPAYQPSSQQLTYEQAAALQKARADAEAASKPSVDKGIQGIFTFIQNNLALVAVCGVGAFLLFKEPPRGKR